MLFSYPEVLYHCFGSSVTFVLDETHWQRINAKVTSHMFSFLASVEGTTVCLEIPLQSPPPPPGRPSLGNRPPPPHPGDHRALTREFARGGEGTSYSYSTLCDVLPRSFGVASFQPPISDYSSWGPEILLSPPSPFHSWSSHDLNSLPVCPDCRCTCNACSPKVQSLKTERCDS